jgi:hypothetical protein
LHGRGLFFIEQAETTMALVNRRVLIRNDAYSSRRRSFSSSTSYNMYSDIDAIELERFLVSLSSDYVKKLLTLPNGGLSQRLLIKGARSCSEERGHVISILADLVNGENVPARVVYLAHLFTGQMYEAQGQYEAAIRSYLNSTWIATAAKKTITRQELAMTLHRLGTCYG